MKKEYVAPKTMIVEMAENLMESTGWGSRGDQEFSNSMSFMDFGGSAGGSRVAFN